MTSKPPSVLIATPMYGGMCTGHYVHGLLMSVQRLAEAGINSSWCQIANESLITRARNELARIFLASEHDYLMFIDADIGFGGEEIVHLINADKDVVCGIYPKKEVDWDSVERAAAAGKKPLSDYAGTFVLNVVSDGPVTTDETGCVEVRHGGTGFMLIKRGVFERLLPHVPTYRVSSFKDEQGNYAKPLTHEFFATSIDESGALLSEDYHFCELVRQHGGSIHAHPFMRLSHVGTYTFGGDVLKSGVNLK